VSIDTFANAYVECLIWQGTDVDPVERDIDPDAEPQPLEELGYTELDLSHHALEEIGNDCRDFYGEHADQWRAAGWDDEQAGHDFCLTRNGHGAGFWDRGKGAVGDELTAACKPYGEQTPYIGDDGKLYV
jgi:hypothetical protein